MRFKRMTYTQVDEFAERAAQIVARMWQQQPDARPLDAAGLAQLTDNIWEAVVAGEVEDEVQMPPFR